MFITRLDFELGEVNRVAIEARWSSGFQASDFETKSRETSGQSFCGAFTDATTFGFRFTGVHECAKECSCGDDDGATGETRSVSEHDCSYPCVVGRRSWVVRKSRRPPTSDIRPTSFRFDLRNLTSNDI